MRQTYDVIIVGAGIIGLSIAHYLKKKGCRRVLILEKEESWISGSTPRANGGFRQQFSTPVNIRLSQISLAAFERFEDDFETDISFKQNGYLFLTSTPSGERGLRANIELQLRLGVPVEWVTPADIESRAPFVRTSDLRGGTLCLKDGYADPYSIAVGFGESARRQGAEIRMHHEVTGIDRSEGRITGVRAAGESFQAPCLVNAAGPHAARLGGLAGVELPIQPVRRMLVMSEDFPEIPEDIPMIIDIDSGFLLRKESGRVLMGWSDPDEPPGFNLQFDPAIIDIVAEKAVRRIPLLEKVHINTQKCWAGLYSVTPDHHCILGEAPALKGFFLANGFSGHGMMHSPAVGMIVADLILDGSTDLMDISPLRWSRFAEGDLIEETVVL